MGLFRNSDNGLAAYEAWIGDISYDPATTDMADGELEGEE